jgi:hypothetical protein
LHYRADPEKRSEEYKAKIKAGIPFKTYMMEYELSWEKFSGLPVFSDFNERIHSVKDVIMPWFGLPLLLGFDFGLTPACVVAQLQAQTFCVLKEFVALNMGIEKFLEIIIPELRTLYPGWGNLKKDFLTFIDPAGFAKKDTDERTCALFLEDAGLSPSPGGITWAERKSSVEKYLTRVYQGNPAFQISAIGCPVLLKGFKGGYQYAEGQDRLETLKVRALKNEFSHPHDALQMITTRIREIQKQLMRSIPKPQYSFQSKA